MNNQRLPDKHYKSFYAKKWDIYKKWVFFLFVTFFHFFGRWGG